MMKQRIRLNESQLKNIVRRCVNEAVGNTEEEKVQKAINALISVLPEVEAAGDVCIFDGYDADPRISELIMNANDIIYSLYRYVSEKNKTYFDRDRERYD